MSHSVFGTPDAIKPVIPAPKPYVYLGVILVAILIECLCPIKETIKAIKTPIRDIIFNTKDTEYRPSRIFTMIGLILLAVSIVTFFFKDSFVLSMVCFVSFIAATAMLFNYVERFIAKLLSRIFEKTGKPIAHLAAIEAGSKKSSVGSSVLCLTAAALAIVLYIFTNSLAAIYDHGLFDSDVIAQINGCKPEIISYVDDLDGVERSVFHYFTSDKIKLGDHKLDANVYGLSSVDEMIKTVDLSKDGAADDEILIDSVLMKKYGLNKGDEINVTFLYDGYLPMERTLKIGGTVDFDYLVGQGSSIVISEKTYKEIYNDFPLFLLVKGSDAKAVKKTIQDPPELDKAMNKMFDEIIGSYDELIKKADWLTSGTREALLKKLHNVHLVTAPKPSEKTKKDTDIIGKNYVDTCKKINLRASEKSLETLKRKVDRDDVEMSAMTVNAQYLPCNTINVTVAIMQKPMFDPKDSDAANLGRLGAVMAHEIGHAFDSNCIKFNPDGILDPDWINETDRKVLEERADKLADYYSKFTIMEVYHVKGEKTNGENYADLGAVECITNIIDDKEQLKVLFENYAKSWCSLMVDTNGIWAINHDEHSPGTVRVNAVLASNEKFIEVYDVKEGDGMYFPPEERVSRW